MKRAAIIVFLLALAATGGWFASWLQHAGAADPDASPIVEVPVGGQADATPQSLGPDRKDEHLDAATTAATPPSAATPGTTEAFGPLPAPDEPIAAHLDELRRRAAAGDARAACRIAMALDACSTLPQLAGYNERSVAMQAAMNMRKFETGEPLARHVARLERVCAGVVPIDNTEAFRLQQQAALAGNRESLFRAAAAPALRLEDLLANVPEWSLWRDRAFGYLEQSLAQGDARAVDALAMAYREGPFLRRPRIVAADSQRGYLYARLRTRIAEAAGEPPARIAAMVGEEASWSLDDSGRAAAESEAARLFEAYFAGRPAQRLDLDGFVQDDFEACER